MPRILPEDFICPQCRQQPTICWAATNRRWSIRRIDLPYFICADCRTFYLSKQLTRQTISQWRNDDHARFGAKTTPYNLIYQEIIKFLEQVIEYYLQIGYRFVKFPQKPIKKKRISRNPPA